MWRQWPLVWGCGEAATVIIEPSNGELEPLPRLVTRSTGRGSQLARPTWSLPVLLSLFAQY